MDSPWREELYKPSSACEIAPHQVLEAESLDNEIKDLSQFTKDITAAPFDPESWLNRGNCLRRLGFPELAVGDVYKARLLVEAALANDSDVGHNAYDAYSKKIYQLHQTHPSWIPRKALVATPELLRGQVTFLLKRLEVQIWTELMEGLMASNSCTDYLAVSKDAVAKFPDDEIFPSEVNNAESWFEQRQNILQSYVDGGEMAPEAVTTTLYNGGVYPTAYPWMTEEFAARSNDSIQRIATEFGSASSNCVVSRSAIRDINSEHQSTEDAFDGQDTSEDQESFSNQKFLESDVLGVIATRDIAAQETVLIDPTLAAVVNSADRCPSCCGPFTDKITKSCCSTSYCSSVCSQNALDSFHPVVCGRDLAFLYEDKSSATYTESSLESQLLLRVLAMAIKEDCSHPLDTSIISRLTPAYNTNDPQLISFNFKDHIITPNRILRELGVDIFTNHLYDTWVLHTIRCRMQNNKHGQGFDEIRGTAINPLYSMFNHNCDPNVDWRHDNENSTVTLFAERDIKQGEEMFISYIEKGKSREERQAKLMPWFGMQCACHKCEQEDESEEVETGV